MMTEPLSDEIKAAIRKEALSQSSKWLIGGGAALLIVAAVGWWYALAPSLSGELGVLPQGAVVAFNHEKGCPTGWQPYHPAAGKVVVGVRNTRENNFPFRKLGETGGTQVYLSEGSGMPRHYYDGGVLYAEGEEMIGLQVRGGTAFYIMPPFVALHYCLKTSGPQFGG